jgi:Asp-tRNA(Asn)/Glu-tRNA(Gln) amidotransferase A subunit family amidase
MLTASPAVDRRRFLAVCSAFGFGSTLLPGVLYALAEDAPAKKVTRELIDDAALIAGVDIKDEYKDLLLDSLNDNLKSFEALHRLNLPNSLPPALVFDPLLPGMEMPRDMVPGFSLRSAVKPFNDPVPANLEDVAYWPLARLAELLRTKKVSAAALTEMYLERIRRYDPILHFMITLTEDRARAQAREADREIAAGRYRGVLHGLPWGAKDLLAVKGYRTTWGAAGFEQQRIEEDATVVTRLDQAGAVLVGKLTLGALALGDYWFGPDSKGERTRNPWRPEQGSSGSSAGPSSAVAAGCVAFAIGSETLGSISSPSTRCGNTGLRPTFGRVPRTGAMALSWSMDKLGPICRYADDCGHVLKVIYGPDQKDPAARSSVFQWNPAYSASLAGLKVGYLKSEFEKPLELPPEMKPEERERAQKNYDITRRFNDAALDVLRRRLGLALVPVELPQLPVSAMLIMLGAESAAAFDDLTRSGRDRLLNAQSRNDWPNYFRAARFIPAVEYVNASRARTLLMQQMAEVFRQVDVLVAPTNSDQLLITNLTGHPALIAPHGFRPADAPAPSQPTAGGGPGTPTSITFLGNLFCEAQLLAVAKAYQDATDFHLRTPESILAAALRKG